MHWLRGARIHDGCHDFEAYLVMCGRVCGNDKGAMLIIMGFDTSQDPELYNTLFCNEHAPNRSTSRGTTQLVMMKYRSKR
jgi:hypothetical protein